MSFIFKWNRTRRNHSLKRLFLFYGICFAITALLAWLLADHTCVTLASFFPAIFAIGMIGVADKTAKGFQGGAIAPTLSEVDEKFTKLHVATELIGEYFCLLIVPVFFPFIFFFSSMTKIIACTVIFLSPFPFMLVVAMIYNHLWVKSIKKQNQDAQNEMEEQKKREELGKWK